MKAQPVFVSTQVHRGIAGSGVILSYAVWQSVAHSKAAFTSPESRAGLANDPKNATVSPHLFRRAEISGLCIA